MPRDVARHGLAEPRDLVRPDGNGRGGHFGRMFGFLPVDPPSAEALADLAGGMRRVAGEQQNRGIPAGHTYLAQFVDHDITFDTTSQFERDNDPDTLPNARTPRLDLDSVYGAGPVDAPFLYDWSDASHGGARLLVDDNRDDPQLATFDLPRNRPGRALIGDPRNDENLIVSQLHALVLRFHNKVVDALHAAAPHPDGMALFETARRAVRHRYQSIVLHELLPRLLGRPAAERRFYDWRGPPFIPVEFSAAAYRFGHSIVRGDYVLNDPSDPSGSPRSVAILARDAAAGELDHLGGFRRVPRALQIQWKHFFATSGDTAPQPAMLIDEHLSPPLYRLPVAFTRDLPADAIAPDGTTSLALLNLRRGRALALPAGADVARALGLEPLAPERLFEDRGMRLQPGFEAELAAATPLWFYILREAQQLGGRGKHLGPVGGAIVGEVLTALVELDPDSFLHGDPVDVPGLAPAGEDFAMADLVRFAEDNP